jgi:hypothetical protein
MRGKKRVGFVLGNFFSSDFWFFLNNTKIYLNFVKMILIFLVSSSKIHKNDDNHNESQKLPSNFSNSNFYIKK